MLAKENRVRTADDFRATVRRGRRFATPHTVVYVAHNQDLVAPKFGFIITKAVGKAVTRNLLRRRLRGISQDIIVARGASPDLAGANIVVRVLPPAASISWSTLHTEIENAVSQSVRQA
jgi:ribonuclease P protein component